MNIERVDFSKGSLIERPSKEETDLYLENLATRIVSCINRKIKEKGFATVAEVKQEACPEFNLGAVLDRYGNLYGYADLIKD
jgi:hypothetical protein